MSTSQPVNVVTNRGRVNFFVGIFKNHWALLGVYLAIVAAGSISNAVIPYFTKLQIDTLEQKRSLAPFITENPLTLLLLLLIIPALIELLHTSVLFILDLRVWSLLNVKLKSATEQLVWDKMKKLDAGFFQSERNKKLVYDVVAASDVVLDLFRFLTSRTASVFTLLAIIPLLGLVSKELLLLVIVTAVVQYIVNTKLSSIREGYTFLERRATEKQWKVRDVLEKEFFKLKSMGVIDRFIDEFYKILTKVENLQYKRETRSALYRSLHWFSESFLLIGANLFVGYQVIYGDMSIGTFTLVVSYTSQISNFFRTMINSADEWRSMSVSLTKLHFFFNLHTRLNSITNSQVIPEDSRTLSLAHVDFEYPNHYQEEKNYIEYMIKDKKMKIEKYKDEYNRDEIEELEKILADESQGKQVLSDINLTVEKGTIVALVGKNGSGKTTITHLLQHHYEPTAGVVALNGTPIYEYDQEQLINCFSWLQQEPFILERYSIKENLLLGSNSESSQQAERMNDVIEKLNMKELIECFPKGLETIIGEDTSLSGGQRQLIAIARSLIQDRPFIIFDEGSSQLDIEKEYNLLKVLSRLKHEKGILFITHRMSVASKADYIYVIDNGRVAESGKHTALLNKKGIYSTFWKMQTEFELTEV